jgi:transmembrane sensor
MNISKDTLRPLPSTTKPSGSGPRDPICTEAVEWFVAFCEQEMDSERCKVFDAWLKASPENVRAYLQISSFWEAAGSLNKNRRAMDELVARAAAENNVIAFDASEAEWTPREEGPVPGIAPTPMSSAHRAGGRRFALAASLLLGLTGLWAAWQWQRNPVYATQIGEFRSVTLSDGSVVELNAHSRVRVEYGKTLRRVALLEGQALFRVAKNHARPFVVVSGSTQVRAVGTQFDVNREVSGTTVTVIEGQVAVTDGEPPVPSPQPAGVNVPPAMGALLKAGSQVRVAQHIVSIPVLTNTAAAIAWTQGTLVFDSALITDMLAEVNRYNPRPLVIDDPKVLAMHVSGTFSSSDSGQIAQFLSQRFGLKVEESADAVHLIRR